MDTLSDSLSSNGSAHHFDAPSATTTAVTSDTGSRRRNILTEATSLISNGGLGRPSSTPLASTNTHPFSTVSSALEIYESQFLPSRPRSLAGIAVRSFALGVSLVASLFLAIHLSVNKANPIWRAPFFITTLSTFHFLEFYITALANTPDAQISSFLLSSNGSAYTIAHTTALLECLLSHLLLPTSFSLLPSWTAQPLTALGFVLLVLGQVARSMAMYQAGTNFSHLVAHTKRATHTLITTGVYRYLRHPSYFGFFWWGIGTQLICGNRFSLLGYAVVLWKFFSRRVEGEEELLVKFFGNEYVDYRKRSWVGIPFV